MERGVELVGATGEALTGLMARATQMDSLNSDIARSAEEQSITLAQVNSAVNEMDRVTQQNAAMVEETTAAAAQLHGRAGELDRAVSRFDLGPDAQGFDAEAEAEELRRPDLRNPGPRNPVHAAQRKLRAAVGGGSDWTEF